MNINELAKEVHENAVNHGWWEKPPSLPEALCLIHGELSEALEEYRNGSPLVYGTCALSPDDCDFALTCENVGHPDAGGEKAGACKPEGIAVELADVILRTLDLMAALGVDVDAVVMAKHRYNLGREYRHGGKRILGGNRERKGSHLPARPCRLRAPRPGNPRARSGLSVLFRRGRRRAPDPIRGAVLQAVSRRDRRPSQTRAFPKGLYSSPFRFPRAGNGFPQIPRDNVSCGP